MFGTNLRRLIHWYGQLRALVDRLPAAADKDAVGLLLARALGPWSVGAHFLYGPAHRATITTVMRIAQRQKTARRDHLCKIPKSAWIRIISLLPRVVPPA